MMLINLPIAGGYPVSGLAPVPARRLKRYRVEEVRPPKTPPSLLPALATRVKKTTAIPWPSRRRNRWWSSNKSKIRLALLLSGLAPREPARHPRHAGDR